MPGLLLIAHAPLASAMKAVAEHTFPNCAPQLAVLDVSPEMSAEEVEVAARALLAGAGHEEALVLTDVFGATPCNGALRLQGPHVRVVSGVNVPMLWRSLCYANEPLEDLAERASQGGVRGIVLNEIPVNPCSKP
ncbi:PTS sugar transporter subunit IIA [Paucibacter sp. Y2R2-4]|uniref:PTS sugar transporter subunit IIA n=1 Tax=Paucibacter sp. Y2R2-4 TaxID=2893553 RepID=UPI0021E43D58|nr:PTS fructose transporter subunit IIA [Paucibacter sp. Y2R2-4]MCV2351125.1 PTS fructose transporter subunit IIA [Paucibacter sp. Y2R2-4]